MQSEDLAKIKELNPFKKMNERDFTDVMAGARLLPVPKGKMIFKRADEDSKIYWLVSGSIDLLDENFEAKNRKAGEIAARNPIDNNSPHLLTAVSREALKVLAIERSTLGNFARSKKLTPSTGKQKEQEVDWMSAVVNSPLFEFIPPANIQKLFGKFEAIQRT